jgi:hypothetical protein
MELSSRFSHQARPIGKANRFCLIFDLTGQAVGTQFQVCLRNPRKDQWGLLQPLGATGDCVWTGRMTGEI